MFGSGFSGFFGGGGMGGMGMNEEKETKEVNTTEYYELLEISKTSSSEEIRKAFRKKALKMHPDKGGDPEMFKKISGAYEVLNNPEKRDLYDKYGVEGVQNGGAGGAGGFDDIFSFFTGGRGRKDTGPKKAKPKLVKLEVTLEQIYLGTTKKIKHKRTRVCQKCDGKGGQNVKKCPKCQGKKVVEKLIQIGPGMYSQSRSPCGQCKGEGQIFDEKTRCTDCKGNKIIQKEKQIEVAVQIGCPDEHDYVFTGQSDQYPGIMAGDLYVRILIKEHKVYERRGADLFIHQKIPLLNALTGVTIELTHLDGKKFIVATAPGEIISHKQRKTVKSFGMPFYKDQMSHGNMYIDFEVEYPKKNSLNSDKAKILSEILGGKPKMDQQIPANKKKGKKDSNYMEDFSESDLNKNPKGKVHSSSRYDDDDEEDHSRGGRTQCQQQ